jgi:hypothetical protein
MSTIVTRQTGAAAKGSPLTNTELDNNFINLNADKMEKSGNLGDLADKPAARVNLDVYSTSEAVSQAIAMAIALG